MTYFSLKREQVNAEESFKKLIETSSPRSVTWNANIKFHKILFETDRDSEGVIDLSEHSNLSVQVSRDYFQLTLDSIFPKIIKKSEVQVKYLETREWIVIQWNLATDHETITLWINPSSTRSQEWRDLLNASDHQLLDSNIQALTSKLEALSNNKRVKIIEENSKRSSGFTDLRRRVHHHTQRLIREGSGESHHSKEEETLSPRPTSETDWFTPNKPDITNLYKSQTFQNSNRSIADKSSSPSADLNKYPDNDDSALIMKLLKLENEMQLVKQEIFLRKAKFQEDISELVKEANEVSDRLTMLKKTAKLKERRT